MLQHDLLRDATEVLGGRDVRRERRRSAYVPAKEAAEHALDPAAAILVVVRGSGIWWHVKALRNCERNRPVDERDAKSLRERGTDSAAHRAVRGRQRHEGHSVTGLLARTEV